MRHHRTSAGLIGFAARHRVATTFVTLFLMASPARPDDRQLLQASAGANTNVLVILDSTHTMNNDFSDDFRMPAYMDDFIYPEGSTSPGTIGSKLAAAKSVLRQVVTNAPGINWAFTYYRNPEPTFGAEDSVRGSGPNGETIIKALNGAKLAGQHLANGGMEWLYFADELYPVAGSISSVFPAALYPDIQQGRFMQFGHKPPHVYGQQGLPNLPPFSIAPASPDTQFPYPGPVPGTFKGAFGPHGLNEGKVVYRNPNSPGRELQMKVVQGNYNDPFIVVEIDEWGAPPPTATPTNTPTATNTSTNTPTSTRTFTATRTNTNTSTNTATPTSTFTPSASVTPSNTRTPSNTPSQTNTSTNTATRTSTFTPSITNTPSNTATHTNTFTPSSTRTPSNTSTPSNTATPSNTPSRTNTRTNTFTPSTTFTPSRTFTPSSTRTPTFTRTATNTATRTNTFTPSRTFTRTNTPSITPTRTNTFTPSRTSTSTNTNTPTRTNTPSNTPSRTNTNTPSNTPTATNTPTRTFTRSNTPTRTNTFTPSSTRTFTPSNTPTRTFTRSNTPTRTFTRSNTPTRTNTFTPSRTFTPSNTRTFTASRTPTRTPTRTFTGTNTRTFTPSSTNTFTPSNTRTFTSSSTPTRTPTRTNTFTPTRTPTIVPTDPGGAFPRSSLLPTIAKWFAPVVRGLFAMAPPPPPLPPTGPCPGIPASYTGLGQLICGPCNYPVIPGAIVQPEGCNAAVDPTCLQTRYCAFVDRDGDGVLTQGVDDSFVENPFPPIGVFPYRGFDDPQYDPDPTFTVHFTGPIQIKFVRGDLYPIPSAPYQSDDGANGNPPWGSCPTGSLAAGCPAIPDNDADGLVDATFITDRHNKGMYPALYEQDPMSVDAFGNVGRRTRPYTVYPLDAFAGSSCPLNTTNPGQCPDPWNTDCGGFAHFNTFKNYPGMAPAALGPPDAATPAVYPNTPPDSPEDWPVVPFRREWLGTDYPGGNSPETAIKRLLRFASSIVSYNSGVSSDLAYTLAEDAKEVIVTSSGTPIAGVLRDAYNYFVKSVFPPADNYAWSGAGTPPAPDPAIDCRNYIIVLLTDGVDECGSDGAICANGPTGLGVAGDLGEAVLPESAPGRRAAAHALDPNVNDKGIPVYVVGMKSDPSTFAPLQCIADNSGGQLFPAGNRADLQKALESIIGFRQGSSFFASPAVPAFAGAVGDTAQIGAVIPSHKNPNGDLSSWSIWSGTIKSYQLDSNGLIPVVTAAASTPAATPVATAVGTPTPTPVPASAGTFPDETDPNNGNAAQRKPVWSAGRVLGYTDPVANLAEGAGASPASPAGRAPAISVWPGRKMVFAQGAGIVPLTRSDFLPDTGTCSGGCFDSLMTDMNLLPVADPAKRARAVLTVQFLRGGITAFGRRDEVLEIVKPGSVTLTIGPGSGEDQRFSYFYQDDQPKPGNPQVLTDDDGTPPAGYAHKLGDIFHSEPVVVEPPRYFQYLSAALTPRTSPTTTGQPYLDFANQHAKRRRVLLAGANDGFLHAFDTGVWNRDAANFPDAFDLGTGREIFAYAPRQVMSGKFESLLNFPPTPQYFVDGSMTAADVFVDPAFAGTPDETERTWRTVVVGGLRQGGSGYYALDVTQPDDIDTTTGSPTFGEIVGNKDASPGCLNGGGASCVAGAASGVTYPEILWEFTDSVPALCSDACALNPSPQLGETWSRPVIGRIKAYDPSSPTADGAGFDDRYVAIFGGGFDPNFIPGSRISTNLPKGRAFYIVDVETGKILYKMAQGEDGLGTAVAFAPMPSAPAVADYNDDGYLDVAYIGDVNGNMWRIDLTPNATSSPKVGEVTGGQLHGYKPFLLFNGCGTTADAVCPNSLPIFYEPGIVYIGGSVNPPTLGIAFGTGDRAELARPNSQTQAFFYVVDSGQTAQTFVSTDLHDLTPGSLPPTGGPCPVPVDPSTCANAENGFVLPYGTGNEKTTSTVFSTLGYLTLITFTPDSVSPCATDGISFRYRFFFLTGQGYYGTAGNYADYQESLEDGFASASQSTSPQGDINDMVLFSGGEIGQQQTPGTVRSIEQNWKEQQQ